MSEVLVCNRAELVLGNSASVPVSHPLVCEHHNLLLAARRWLLLVWLFISFAHASAPSVAQIEALIDQRRLGAAHTMIANFVANDRHSQAELQLVRARSLLALGRVRHAELAIQNWRRDFSDADGYLMLRARVLQAMARTEIAATDAAVELQALRADVNQMAPDDRRDELWLIRAEIEVALGAALTYANNKNARATLARALQIVPQNKPLLRAQAACWMAYAQLLAGDVPSARKAVELALSLRAKHAPGSVSEAVALYFSNLVHRAEGNARAADRSLSTAISLLEAERWQQSTDYATRLQWSAQFAFFYRDAIFAAAERGDLAHALEFAQRFRRSERSTSASAKAMQSSLASGETLLSFVVHDQRSAVLIADRNSIFFQDLALSSNELREQVRALNVLIAARDKASAHAFSQRSRTLYKILVAPALAKFPNTERLLLQPDGVLHELAFAALQVEPEHYLVEDVVLARGGDLAHRPVAATAVPLWIFADPAMPNAASGWLRDGGRTALPGARREARALAALFAPNSKLWLGSQATVEALAHAPKEVDLHIATHMLRLPDDEREAAILLYPDALFTSSQVRLLTAKRGLVVLSGCASEDGEWVGGAGALSLAQAWHDAGAQRVLATLWPVPDYTTAELMSAFHSERTQHLDAALALAQAQRAWLKNARALSVASRLTAWWYRQTPEHWTLPFYWAAPLLSE